MHTCNDRYPPPTLPYALAYDDSDAVIEFLTECLVGREVAIFG